MGDPKTKFLLLVPEITFLSVFVLVEVTNPGSDGAVWPLICGISPGSG